MRGTQFLICWLIQICGIWSLLLTKDLNIPSPWCHPYSQTIFYKPVHHWQTSQSFANSPVLQEFWYLYFACMQSLVQIWLINILYK